MQTIYCDAGCGRVYQIKTGEAGNPVDSFWCPEHFIQYALTVMNAWEQIALAAEASETGTQEEAREVEVGRSKGKRGGPRRLALDDPLRPVVEDPAPPAETEDATG